MLFRERQLMNSFKPGDWIILSNSSDSRSLAQVKETYSDSNKAKLYWPSENYTAVCSEMQYYELWQPKPNEWVVIADDITPDLYAVFQFNNHSKDRQILPFAFLQTLKDQS